LEGTKKQKDELINFFETGGISPHILCLKGTAHSRIGFAAPHITWLFIRFQPLQAVPAEGRCVFVKKDQCSSKLIFCTIVDDRIWGSVQFK
jgi:hypothetical protein